MAVVQQRSQTKKETIFNFQAGDQGNKSKMSKQPPIPGMNPGETLDQFHDRAIIPSRDEISSKLAAIDEFIRAVEGAFSKSGQSIAEIHKSGSLGKGTAIRGGADIDLVVYFNGLSTMNDLKSKRPQLLKDLEQKISEIRLWTGRVRLQGKTPYALAYTFDGEQMDILPGFDIVKAYPGGLKTIYSELSALSSPACSASEAQNYSVSLAPLQIKFVKGHNETVKRGIRLLKYWKQAKNLDLRSYAMELLAIHAARSGHEKSTKDVF